MATSFSRTLRSLNADRFRATAFGFLVIAILLGVWLVWFVLAKTPIYEVSDEARLEVDRSIRPLEAMVSSRVVATRLAVGREVQAEEVVVELDSQTQRLQHSEEESRLLTLTAQLASQREQISYEKRSREETNQGAAIALNEARARFAEAEASAQTAAEEAAAAARLYKEGLVSEVEMKRAKTEVQKRQSAAEALRLAISRQAQEQQARDTGQQARFETFTREIARIEGEIAVKAATIERLKREIEERQIRAPASGKLGEVADLQIGQIVHAGNKLGTIVPSGNLRVIAEFHPSAALGRVREGQKARLRLDGFPWTEHGEVTCQVIKVASEPRSGTIRVELSVINSPPSIPLQHGLPGSVEIEVEKVSPATLVLRAAGKSIIQPTAKTPVQKHEGEH